MVVIGVGEVVDEEFGEEEFTVPFFARPMNQPMWSLRLRVVPSGESWSPQSVLQVRGRPSAGGGRLFGWRRLGRPFALQRGRLRRGERPDGAIGGDCPMAVVWGRACYDTGRPESDPPLWGGLRPWVKTGYAGTGRGRPCSLGAVRPAEVVRWRRDRLGAVRFPTVADCRYSWGEAAARCWR